jgi:uncharacterized coiled-coil protein SlyX
MGLNAEQIRYKMSEEQIKTALKCLSKPNSSPADREKCYFMWEEPSCFSCYHEVAQNALALITSQEQRIGAQDMTISELRKLLEKANHDADRYAAKNKELTVKLDAMSGEANSYKRKNKDFAEEIKRLEASVEANRFIALEALGGIAYGINEKNRDCETERFVMAEVVKEVESRLKEYFTCDNNDRYSGKAVWDAIEQVSEQLRSIGWTGWKPLKK